jgi:hypothetical protein
MGTGIPQEAVGASAAVLSYSIICLLLASMLICMLWSYGERWTCEPNSPYLISKSNIDLDITFLSTFSAISTLGSIIQQIHYNTSWAIVKQDDYNTAVKSITNPSLGILGIGNTIDRVLYLIRTVFISSAHPTSANSWPRILLLQRYVFKCTVMVRKSTSISFCRWLTSPGL